MFGYTIPNIVCISHSLHNIQYKSSNILKKSVVWLNSTYELQLDVEERERLCNIPKVRNLVDYGFD